MGAWGSRSFDNDDASDWLAELEVAGDLGVVRSALRVGDHDYLEVPDGSVAMAAAEVVAAALGRPAITLPAVVRLWISRHEGLADASDARRARAAIDRVLADNSELVDLWGESSDKEWRLVLADLRRRLDAVLEPTDATT